MLYFLQPFLEYSKPHLVSSDEFIWYFVELDRLLQCSPIFCCASPIDFYARKKALEMLQHLRRDFLAMLGDANMLNGRFAFVDRIFDPAYFRASTHGREQHISLPMMVIQRAILESNFIGDFVEAHSSIYEKVKKKGGRSHPLSFWHGGRINAAGLLASNP